VPIFGQTMLKIVADPTAHFLSRGHFPIELHVTRNGGEARPQHLNASHWPTMA
jgi:hypothetical protein